MSTTSFGKAVSWPPALDDERSIAERFADDDLIQAAMTAAYHAAIRDHLRTGVPMVVCRDGEVIEVPAEELAAKHGVTLGRSTP